MRGVSSTAGWAPPKLLPFLVLLLVPFTEARHLLSDALAQIHAQAACYRQQDCAKTTPVSAVLPSEFKATQASSPAILPTSRSASISLLHGEFASVTNAHAYAISITEAAPRAPPAPV
jgi:hypothetical protein